MKEQICTRCGHVGHYTLVTRGSVVLEFSLWLVALLGFGYSLLGQLPGSAVIFTVLLAATYGAWRLEKKRQVCPMCREANSMIPIDSPIGKKMTRNSVDSIDRIDISEKHEGHLTEKDIKKLFGKENILN